MGACDVNSGAPSNAVTALRVPFTNSSNVAVSTHQSASELKTVMRVWGTRAKVSNTQRRTVAVSVCQYDRNVRPRVRAQHVLRLRVGHFAAGDRRRYRQMYSWMHVHVDHVRRNEKRGRALKGTVTLCVVVVVC